MDLVKEGVFPVYEEDDLTFYEREIYSFRTDIYRFIYVSVKDRNLAEDLTQDVLEAAWRKRALLRKYESIRGALFVMAKHKVIERHRKKRVTTVPIEDGEYLLGSEEESALRSLLAKEQHFELMHYISKLREDHKRVVLLRYYYGLSLKEVAAITDVPYNTIISWHGRAVRKLAEFILEDQKGKEDPDGIR